MTQHLNEPGFWILLGLLVVGLGQLFAAVLSRKLAAQLSNLVGELTADPKYSAADRGWLHVLLDGTSGRFGWKSVARAPLMVIFGPRELLPLLWKHRDLDGDGQLRALDNESDEIDARHVEEETGSDPRRGKLWKDARRRRMDNLATLIAMTKRPFSSLWIFLWALLAALVLLPFAAAALGGHRAVSKVLPIFLHRVGAQTPT